MKNLLPCGLIATLFLAACRDCPQRRHDLLEHRLYTITDSVPGMVGIAFVSDRDTVTVNNGVAYPMMSVFKLHQALAVGAAVASWDSVLTVRADELDPHTWSPMLKVLGSGGFDVSVGELVRYAVTSSDNNASNLLFSHISSPADTRRFVKSVAADTSFQILYSEAEMKREHSLSYLNYTSPLSAALLIRQVFTSDLIGAGAQDSIRSALMAVTTGHDRLGAAITEADDVLFGHKTGSGYRNSSGELIAHNDVGYFRMSDGRDYALAVLIRDFRGTEDEASAVMADISRLIYDWFVSEGSRY
ncbi:MAG: class A beta-lactamase-related serine hydrolase [Muribaculaceae bacterium]|nr:class A beta-lactamase-related serine hydrolase [Muribaculaceae bacterium]